MALAAVAAVAALLLAGCGRSDRSAGSGSGGSAGGEQRLSGEITVSAASSLTEAYTRIGRDFEAAHPGTRVRLNFDSSGTLSEQIRRGAPVDVFASADTEKMAKLERADRLDGAPAVFARNQLAMVTKPTNPKAVATLADLADAGVVSLCSEDAPCGSFAAEALDRAGVEIPEGSTTRGQNVKATLTAVTEGDAVAAIVYVSDAVTAGDQVQTVDIPADQNVIADYPVAVVAGSRNPALARAFVTQVRSPKGQAVLAGDGFLPPT